MANTPGNTSGGVSMKAAGRPKAAQQFYFSIQIAASQPKFFDIFAILPFVRTKRNFFMEDCGLYFGKGGGII